MNVSTWKKTWKQPVHQRERCLKICRKSSGASPVVSTCPWYRQCHPDAVSFSESRKSSVMLSVGNHPTAAKGAARTAKLVPQQTVARHASKPVWQPKKKVEFW